jgi:hypothetical protein
MVGHSAGWATTTVFAAAVAAAASDATAIISTTAITAATNYLETPSTCNVALAVSTTACSLAGSITATATSATTVGSTTTFSWYQPDENSDGYTTTMPRFSAEESIGWW